MANPADPQRLLELANDLRELAEELGVRVSADVLRDADGKLVGWQLRIGATTGHLERDR